MVVFCNQDRLPNNRYGISARIPDLPVSTSAYAALGYCYLDQAFKYPLHSLKYVYLSSYLLQAYKVMKLLHTVMTNLVSGSSRVDLIDNSNPQLIRDGVNY